MRRAVIVVGRARRKGKSTEMKEEEIIFEEMK